jgi:hypothetical protein
MSQSSVGVWLQNPYDTVIDRDDNVITSDTGDGQVVMAIPTGVQTTVL